MSLATTDVPSNPSIVPMGIAPSGGGTSFFRGGASHPHFISDTGASESKDGTTGNSDYVADFLNPETVYTYDLIKPPNDEELGSVEEQILAAPPNPVNRNGVEAGKVPSAEQDRKNRMMAANAKNQREFLKDNGTPNVHGSDDQSEGA